MEQDKDLPRSYCLAVAFLRTETSLHSETFKFIHVGQAPHVIRTNEFSFTFKRRISFCYYSRNLDPRLSLYTKIEQGSSSQTPSIFWKYTEQKIACILQCKNSATKSFIADQETVSRD